MRDRSVIRVLVLSSLITFAFAVLGVLFGLLQSLSVSRTSGVGLAARGFSENFVTLMVIGLPLVFGLSYFLLRPRKSLMGKRNS